MLLRHFSSLPNGPQPDEDRNAPASRLHQRHKVGTDSGADLQSLPRTSPIAPTGCTMRNSSIPWLVLCLALCSQGASAQDVTPPPGTPTSPYACQPDAAPLVAPCPEVDGGLCCEGGLGGGCPYPPGRVWVDAEYLLWWTKGSPLPPLLTTSPPGTPDR